MSIRVFILLFIIPTILFSHEKDKSRAFLFKEELRVSNEQFKLISTIDNRYRTKYQKLNAEIQFRNSELNEVIYSSPFNEKKATQILKKIADAQLLIRLNTIKHHLEIEKKLDSYQRMKFNEIFKP